MTPPSHNALFFVQLLLLMCIADSRLSQGPIAVAPPPAVQPGYVGYAGTGAAAGLPDGDYPAGDKEEEDTIPDQHDSITIKEGGKNTAFSQAGGQVNYTAASSSGHAVPSVPTYKPMMQEVHYTTNSFCRQTNCVNPIFPGLNDLPRLEMLTWQCSTNADTKPHMDFCRDVVNYDPALPSPAAGSVNISKLVEAQEDAAMTMFYYHLSGMGYDSWDYRDPTLFDDNECVREVWKMVCFTYFPKVQAGCKGGEVSPYLRPCKSGCENYLKKCNVECCDESTHCVFEHTTNLVSGEVKVLQTGYVNDDFPSAFCTGSAKRSMSSPFTILLALFGLHLATSGESAQTTRRNARGLAKGLLMGLLAFMSMTLQGCLLSAKEHTIGFWRQKPNYMTEFKYTPPSADDGTPRSPMLNSCNVIPGMDTNPDKPFTQCNGRGYCKSFSVNPKAAQQANPLSFCQCERDWADPECGTKRKSQIRVFFYSVFLGMFGADYFYLGYPLWGVSKLLTFGGFGFWWILDIVRTGTGPVYSWNYRVAADLPHWLAVLIMLALALGIGFLVALQWYLLARRKKRADMMIINQKEEARNWKFEEASELERIEGLRFRTPGVPNFEKRPAFCGYGAALPLYLPNAGIPHAAAVLPDRPNPPGPFGPAGIPGAGSPTPPATGIAPTHMAVGREGMMQRLDDDIANVGELPMSGTTHEKTDIAEGQ